MVDNEFGCANVDCLRVKLRDKSPYVTSRREKLLLSHPKTFSYIHSFINQKISLMSIFDKFSNGWTIATTSFKVLKANKQLIIFPILSAVSLILIFGSFFVAVFASAGWHLDNLRYSDNKAADYAVLFAFYVVNYFIVVFFNMALIHCAKLYFDGEEVTVKDGINFSISRIGVIFSWAVLAATVGLILRAIQENVGSLGKMITGLIGVVWSIATFFVVPVIAYEKLGPIDAVNRSIQLMRQKWGESIGAGFSFGLIQFLAIILLAVPAFIIGAAVHVIAGVAFFILGVFLLSAIFSAVRTIFISAVYNNVTGDLDGHFNQQMIDGLFIEKRK